MKRTVKKTIARAFALILIVMALIAFPACGCNDESENGPGGPNTPPEVKSLNYTVTMPSGLEYNNPSVSIDIFVYEQAKITADAENVEYSSDSDVVTVAQDGTVTAVKTGSATVTLKSGELSSSFALTVNDSGNIPFVTFDNSNVLMDDDGNFHTELFTERTLNTGAAVKYNGITYTVSGFEFGSSDESVATVANGRISAKAEGKALLTVSLASWNGYVGDSLTETIAVTVKPNGSLELASNDVTVYTKSTDTLSDTFDLAPIVRISGQEVSAPTIKYDYDATVIAVEGNVLRGLKAGSTTVTATYTTEKGTDFVTTVNVKVELPLTALDKSLTIERTQFLNLSALLGLNGFTLASASDITDKNNPVEITEQGALDSEKFISGERTWAIYSSVEGYSFDITVADKIITSKGDLVALEGKAESGYYILGANINFGKANYTGLAGANGTFTGTFNGNGYAIDDAIFTAGLVGGTLKNGTVKNIAIVNSEVNGSAHGAIAGTSSGINNIENVFIQLKPALTAWTNSTGAAFYQQEGTLNAKNVISYMQDHRPGNTSNSSFIFYTKQGAVINATNVIAGSDVNRSGGTGAEMLPIGNKQGSIVGTITNYSSLAEIQSAAFDISAFGDFDFIGELKSFLNRKKTVTAVAGNAQTEFTYALGDGVEILETTLNGSPLGDYTYEAGNFSVAIGLLTQEVNTVVIKTKLMDYEIAVSVKEDGIELDVSDVTLYTEASEGRANAVTLEPIVRVNGEAVTDAVITYGGYDNTVISISDNTITALKAGDTVVTLTYTPASGSPFTASVNVSVLVYIPLNSLNKSITVDKAVTGAKIVELLELSDFTLTLAEDITDSANPITIATDGSFDGSKFTTGARTWAIFSDSVGYSFSVTVADKIIMTKEELANLEGKVTSGYYMLGAEIDMGNANYAGLAGASGTFTGTFDGQGFAITNVIFTAGLLGNNAQNVTVKNIAIVASEVNGASHGAIAGNALGTNRIENVFIRLKPALTAWTNSTGAMFYSQEGSLTVVNAIAYMEDHRSSGNSANSSFIYYTKAGSTLNVTNVISGSDVNREGGSATEMKPIGSAQGTLNGTITNYSSLAAMQAANIDTSAYANFDYYTHLTAFLTAA